MNEKLTSQEEIQQNGLIFCLDKDYHTAWVKGNDDSIINAVIPLSIVHEEQKFIVTCIKEGSFASSQTIESVNLPFDSKVQIIEKDALSNSAIKNILISNSAIELKE